MSQDELFCFHASFWQCFCNLIPSGFRSQTFSTDLVQTMVPLLSIHFWQGLAAGGISSKLCRPFLTTCWPYSRSIHYIFNAFPSCQNRCGSGLESSFFPSFLLALSLRLPVRRYFASFVYISPSCFCPHSKKKRISPWPNTTLFFASTLLLLHFTLILQRNNLRNDFLRPNAFLS